MQSKFLSHRDVTYLDRLLLDEQGRLQVVPSSALSNVSQDDLSYWGNRRGIYGIPTTETIDWLRQRIGGREALEVGAGNGVFGRALGVRMTDSWIQARPDIILYYQMTGQVVVPYGADVERIEATQAVKKYKPKVVFGSWVTEVFKDGQGFAEGLDEEAILKSVDEYIVIGNLFVHGTKRILKNPPSNFTVEALQFPWVYSRSFRPEGNAILSWRRRK